MNRFDYIDERAPIIPGVSAAGISVGADIRDIVTRVPASACEQLSQKSSLHRFRSVRVWSSEGIIDQIGVGDGYLGTLFEGAIHLGSTIAEVEEFFGRSPVEDDEDMLVVPGSQGWCFETTAWDGGQTVAENRDARIAEIFVSRQK